MCLKPWRGLWACACELTCCWVSARELDRVVVPMPDSYAAVGPALGSCGASGDCT